MTFSYEALRAEMKARGWRLTPQRERVIEIFLDLPEGQHVSADEVARLLRQRGQPLSVSTVYRTLRVMARLGFLRELELGEGEKVYELNLLASRSHHHLVCAQTGEVVEFADDTVVDICRKVAEKYGFKILDCRLVVYGNRVP